MFRINRRYLVKMKRIDMDNSLNNTEYIQLNDGFDLMNICFRQHWQKVFFASIWWWETNQTITVANFLNLKERTNTHINTVLLSLCCFLFFIFGKCAILHQNPSTDVSIVTVYTMEIFTLRCWTKYEHYFNALVYICSWMWHASYERNV